MLTEKNTIQVEVTETDHVQVRVKTTIYRDGEQVSYSLHRHVIAPGQDYSGEPKKVRRICDNTFVPTVVARYQAEQEYEAAEQEDTPASRKRLKALKTKRDKRRQEYEAFEAT